MARSCCLKVWSYEQDMKLIEHEEKYFHILHADFMKRADVFKVHAKRVYKSLNVLWYSGKRMTAGDSRRAKCLDTVARISVNWMYTDQLLRKEIEGLGLLSRSVPNKVSLSQLLVNMMARVSAVDAQINSNMIWDADCASKLKGAFKEIIPRAKRLVDADWIVRYYFFFEKANKILLENEQQINAYFRATLGGTPEDFPIDSSFPRDQAKPPHEIAFSHVAQIISNRFLDADPAPPEVLDLSLAKSVGVPTAEINNRPEGPNYDELPQLLAKTIAEAPDNVALAIERVVAKFSQADEPECVDLTESPPQVNVPCQKRLAGQEQGTQCTSAKIVRRRLPIGKATAPPAKGVVKNPVHPSSKPAKSAAPCLPVTETEPMVATPTSEGVADLPNESDRSTVGAPVPCSSVQRFLYVSTPKPSANVADLAANELRLGFGGEGAVNTKGALFERLYRPDGVHQRKEFDALLPERATGAEASSFECKSSDHLVPLTQRTGVVKTLRAVKVSGVVNVGAKRKFLEVNEPVEVTKPGKVVKIVDKTSELKFAGNVAEVRRRFVANGRQPFKEIRPALPNTEVVDAGKRSDASHFPPSADGIRMPKMDFRFKPYKLELLRNDSSMPNMLGKAAATGGELEAATKKYDFRARARDGRDGNDVKMEEHGLMGPTIKMRKDLFSKQAPK